MKTLPLTFDGDHLDYGRIGAAARTICRQAIKLGYDVELDRAATGTAYITVAHATWKDEEGDVSEDRLIRVSDHEANEARYQYHVNRRPDMGVDVGFQSAAVRKLAEWIGADPASIPYLRRVATIERKRREAKAAREAQRQAESKSGSAKKLVRALRINKAIQSRGNADPLVTRYRHLVDSLAMVERTGNRRKKAKAALRRCEDQLLTEF